MNIESETIEIYNSAIKQTELEGCDDDYDIGF